VGSSWRCSHLRQRVLCLVVFLFTIHLSPAWADDLEKQLKSDYQGKILTLRHFYTGTKLRFRADGSLQGDARVGPWTVDGRVLVTDIRVRNSRLNITGRRLYLFYDAQTKEFRDSLAAIEAQHNATSGDVEKVLQKQIVQIEIELPSTDPGSAKTSATMKTIFLASGESMVAVVSPAWRTYFEKQEGRPSSIPDRLDGVYTAKSGSEASPPRLTHSPEPEYSEAARQTRAEGIVLLNLIVEADGSARDIQIVTPLGLGLDEEAVVAVSKWKFAPAQKESVPVPVSVNVEVNFHLR